MRLANGSKTCTPHRGHFSGCAASNSRMPASSAGLNHFAARLCWWYSSKVIVLTFRSSRPAFSGRLILGVRPLPAAHDPNTARHTLGTRSACSWWRRTRGTCLPLGMALLRHMSRNSFLLCCHPRRPCGRSRRNVASSSRSSRRCGYRPNRALKRTQSAAYLVKITSTVLNLCPLAQHR